MFRMKGIIIVPIPAQDLEGPPHFLKIWIPNQFPYVAPFFAADMPFTYSKIHQ